MPAKVSCQVSPLHLKGVVNENVGSDCFNTPVFLAQGSFLTFVFQRLVMGMLTVLSGRVPGD